MNRLLFAFFAILLSLPVHSAKTENGELKVRAVIRNNTCSVAAASHNIVLNMGAEATKIFYQPGVAARENPFDIILENCGPIATGVRATLSGNAHAANSTLFALNSPLAPTTARNIGIAVYDQNGTLVGPGNTSGTYALNGQLSNGLGLRFVARYVSTATPVIAGRANGSMTFTLTYD
ncbi:fimbrial protein [Enterobacter kobei]|uniref:fimbrial protein n=1 Tax=Enterobacter kobei TaxID=208224 RepID=UPI0012563E64|nr:fimbrial protein [Enterobacter kobei]VAL18822.1 type 1 fimbrae adaptor subunit FimF [Enterobacter kobei]